MSYLVAQRNSSLAAIMVLAFASLTIASWTETCKDEVSLLMKRSKLSRSNSENFSRRPSASRVSSSLQRGDIVDTFAGLSVEEEVSHHHQHNHLEEQEEQTPLMDHLKMAGSTLAGTLIYNQVMSYDTRNDQGQRHHLNTDMPNYFAGPDPMHTVVGAAVGSALYSVITEPSETFDNVKDCFQSAYKAASTCLPYSQHSGEGHGCNVYYDALGGQACPDDGNTPTTSAPLRRTNSSRAIKEAARQERMTRTRLKKSRSRKTPNESDEE